MQGLIFFFSANLCLIYRHLCANLQNIHVALMVCSQRKRKIIWLEKAWESLLYIYDERGVEAVDELTLDKKAQGRKRELLKIIFLHYARLLCNPRIFILLMSFWGALQFVSLGLALNTSRIVKPKVFTTEPSKPFLGWHFCQKKLSVPKVTLEFFSIWLVILDLASNMYSCSFKNGAALTIKANYKIVEYIYTF